jgi:glycine/serine hydroxymethyltransferase
MKRDQEIFDLISQENDRQLHGIELIASEKACISLLFTLVELLK